ncbi:MAG: TIGR01621 family pseudouridine synthase [Chitinivibrionales bacterium]|nr:TIGR01621 family pseudouridine synthase [Chitinivibrionales bacterium]
MRMYSVVDDTDSFLLINKHPGVDFHRNQHTVGLVDVVRNQSGFQNLYPVHRLDTMSSGLLLFAKTKEICRCFADLFITRKIEKYYCAISDRKPTKPRGIISGDMVRSRRGGWKLTRSQENPAQTLFISVNLAPGLRLFIIRPLTGKTHQIRVALKSIGTPILGDPLYHAAVKTDGSTIQQRGYLHAFCLRFPLEGKDYSYICPPDNGFYFLQDVFNKTFQQFCHPWELSWQSLF